MPPNCTVVGVPGRIVREQGRRVDVIDLDHANLPDPSSRSFRAMERRIEALEARSARAGSGAGAPAMAAVANDIVSSEPSS